MKRNRRLGDLSGDAHRCGWFPQSPQKLKDVLTRLPTTPTSRIGELLPHRWQPAAEAGCYLAPTMRIIEPVRASKMPTSITMPGRRAS